ncbi:MAG: class I SAM-dependent methyltransferase [Patescibacteria group bacterium]
MKYEDAYKSTLNVYRKMGRGYLESVKDLTPEQLYDFLDQVVPGGKVLDIGCAGGRDAKAMTEKGFEVVGIDVVDEFLEEAKKFVPEAKFLNMDLLKLDFPEESFDGILASAVLLHISKEDIPRALGNFYRALKPGGKIFSMVKLGEGSTYATDKLSSEKRLMVLFTKKEFRDFFEEAGFEIKKIVIVPDDAGREDVKWIRLIAGKR